MTTTPKRLNAAALNDATWAFIGEWNSVIAQPMPGLIWNNLKPMIEIAIREYLDKALYEQGAADKYHGAFANHGDQQ